MRLLFLSALLLAGGALAQRADVAVVNQLSGEAVYADSKATPFMKVREGDRFTLAPGAHLRLVYLQGGRQEAFTGPASFTAGTRQSALHSGAAPAVTTVPSGVPQRLARVPDLVRNARLGGVQLRGGPAPDEVALRELRALAEELERDFPDNDDVRALAARARSAR